MSSSIIRRRSWLSDILSRVSRHVDLQHPASPALGDAKSSRSGVSAHLETPFGTVLGYLQSSRDGDLTSIGRARNSTIRLSDMFVQPEHARVTWDAGSHSHWIEDASGNYGTYIDGQRVVFSRKLVDGNAISLGKSVLIYRTGSTHRGSMKHVDDSPGTP